MSTVVVRNGRRGVRLRRRTRPARRTNPVVVVASNPGRGRRGRRRRRSRNNSIRPRVGGPSRETFVFSKDSLKGNDSGKITFGPSLSECAAFSGGILKAYHEYKIVSVLLEFISEASSTSAGSMAIELDPHNKLSALASTINKFGLTKTGRRAFTASHIRGREWHDTSTDQFAILYKGNGSASTAGSFTITIVAEFQNPK